MNKLPLLHQVELEAPWIISTESSLATCEVLYAVQSLTDMLPEQKYCLLLCENRRHFLTGFAAALSRGQIVLLPPGRSPSDIADLLVRWPDSYCLVDSYDQKIPTEQVDCSVVFREPGRSSIVPELPADIPAVMLFTSGSTGTPKPNVKTWGEMVAGAARLQNHFEINSRDRIVATVPPQHMFGLETSILLPLFSGAGVFEKTPLFPEDIRLALERVESAATLVVTPVHLRTFAGVDKNWPNIRQVISATAPLSVAVAAENEARLNAPICEILGSTETGAIASRRTIETSEWRMLGELEIEVRGDEVIINGLEKGSTVPMLDRVRVIDRKSFELLGRPDDLIKVAGKRISLADLNLKLNSIQGVVDGAFLVRNDDGENGVVRLAAAVVAPEVSNEDILRALSQHADKVFLPRPLYRVDSIPRNATGKLTRQALQAMLSELEQ